eukprot:1160564-Pelagomonas_calceolata.AAC.7
MLSGKSSVSHRNTATRKCAPGLKLLAWEPSFSGCTATLLANWNTLSASAGSRGSTLAPSREMSLPGNEDRRSGQDVRRALKGKKYRPCDAASLTAMDGEVGGSNGSMMDEASLSVEMPDCYSQIAQAGAMTGGAANLQSYIRTPSILEDA